MPVLVDDPDSEPEIDPLIDAAFRNRLDQVRELIASGIALDPKDNSTSALAHAASQGHLEVARLLLDAGANPNHSPEGLSPLAAACRDGHVAMAEYLLSRGARLDHPRTVFGWSLDRGAKASVLALLVKHGVSPNLVAYGKTSLLMAVCKTGDVATAKQLIALGADVNFRGEGTALTVAEEHGHQVLVDLLLEVGARPSRAPRVPDAQRDALHTAALEHPRDATGRAAWANWLLEHGFRAAAARELQAASRSPPPLGAWRFLDFQDVHERVSEPLADQFFPRALLTDGARTLPLAVLLGSPCTSCDDKGETQCSSCDGTGQAEDYMTGRSHPCPTRQTCFTCKGFKFTVYSKRFGKGACAHPVVDRELELGKLTFIRCTACGLAALDSNWHTLSDPRVGWDFACGVCGCFECRCSTADSAFPPAQEKKT